MTNVTDITNRLHPIIGGIYQFGHTNVEVIQVNNSLVVYEHVDNPHKTNVRSRGSFNKDNFVGLSKTEN